MDSGRQRLSIYRFRHQLFQHYSYNRLDEVERSYLHAAVGEVLEQLYEGREEDMAGQLAHHFQRAGLLPKAIYYLQIAGDNAAGVYAHDEAVTYYTRALDLAKKVELSIEELAHLYLRLGGLLLVTKGDGAPEGGQAYHQAFELYQQVGESPQLFAALRGLAMFYKLRREFEKAHKYTEQLVALAHSLQDSKLIVQASFALGSLLFYSGRSGAAQISLEQGIGSYDRQQNRSLALNYGQDPGVATRSYAAFNLWLLGYPDRAVEQCSEALSLAEELVHPYSQVMALSLSSWVHLFRREKRLVRERTEAALCLSTKHGFRQFVALGTMQRGWALAEQGEVEEGIAQMEQGLAAAAVAICLEHADPPMMVPLAEIYRKVGRPEEGLGVLVKALAMIRENPYSQVMEPEIYRLNGELLLISGQPEADVEANFQKAIDISRRQEAKSLELRAVMSLSRLWQSQGKQEDARQILAAIYDWFTEGLNTHDLQEAKALLKELS